MPERWYALRSKPRKEEVLWRQVQHRGFEVYYPRLKVNPVNPRARRVRPYFPGYLFVKADIADVGMSTFQYMPYAIGLVQFGGVPAPVPANLINTLQDKLQEIYDAGGELFLDLEEGDEVRITHGPFEGYTALFSSQVSGRMRVKVLLEFLSGQFAPLELDASHIEKEKKEKHH